MKPQPNSMVIGVKNSKMMKAMRYVISCIPALKRLRNNLFKIHLLDFTWVYSLSIYQWKFILPASQFTRDNVQYTFIHLLASSFCSKGSGFFCLEAGGDGLNFAWKGTETGRNAYQARNSKKSMHYKLFFKKTHNYDN